MLSGHAQRASVNRPANCPPGPRADLRGRTASPVVAELASVELRSRHRPRAAHRAGQGMAPGRSAHHPVRGDDRPGGPAGGPPSVPCAFRTRVWPGPLPPNTCSCFCASVCRSDTQNSQLWPPGGRPPAGYMFAGVPGSGRRAEVLPAATDGHAAAPDFCSRSSMIFCIVVLARAARFSAGPSAGK